MYYTKGADSKTGYVISIWHFISNVVGCFIIGIFITIVTEKFIVNSYWRLLITTGFLDGLTTFSSYSYETFKLFEDTGINAAFYNIAANLISGLLATWLEIKAIRILF
ncbi:CrcB family protein [Sporomusa sp. KB1]|uniref:fluoride efflux transporter FluC n=1 Tax=Sporomusa sp. KB1 TaxID=943346 RepID=UPI002107E575|nr:CrcB family protein [Sporomusa sp. KB1]